MIELTDYNVLTKSVSKDNNKVFFKKIDKLIKKKIGHKLITFTVIDHSLKYVERVYTNNSKVYPLLGTKRLPKNKWSQTVIKNKKNFLGKNKKDIKKLFFDYEVIFSLGCGSIINFLVKFNNIPIGTINVLKCSQKYKIKKFLYAASSSCYGIPTKYPTPESQKLSPQYPYALTKLLGEQLDMHWSKLYKLNSKFSPQEIFHQ